MTDTWHGGPAHATIRYTGTGPTDNRASDWQLWIPPIAPDCYDGGTLEGALQGPWGDTYWPTQQDACEFLQLYVETHPVCEAGHPLIVLTKGTFWLTAGGEAAQRAVVMVDAGDAGNLDPEPFWIWSCNDSSCTANITEGAKNAAIKQADGSWPCLKFEDRQAWVMMEG